MAQGDLKGTLTVSLSSVANPSNATGSVEVVVGDLVFVSLTQQTNLTASGVTDNLGNTYNPVNAGTDAGTVTIRSFYSRVTVEGTLTTVSVAATPSTNDASVVASVIEGPFLTDPLDANPANTTDATSPYTCPATGVLSQASEVVMAAIGLASSQTIVATAPSVIAGTVARNNASTGHSRLVVSATTSVTPEFTGTSVVSAQVTASFKLDPAQTLTPGLFTNSISFPAPTLLGEYTLTPGLFTNTNTFFEPTVDANSQTVTPGLFTNTQTFFAPTITTEVTVSPSLLTNTNTFFSPSVTSEVTITPGLFTNTNLFFNPQVEAEGGAGPTGGSYMVVLHRRRR